MCQNDFKKNGAYTCYPRTMRSLLSLSKLRSIFTANIEAISDMPYVLIEQIAYQIGVIDEDTLDRKYIIDDVIKFLTDKISI